MGHSESHIPRDCPLPRGDFAHAGVKFTEVSSYSVCSMESFHQQLSPSHSSNNDASGCEGRCDDRQTRLDLIRTQGQGQEQGGGVTLGNQDGETSLGSLSKEEFV